MYFLFPILCQRRPVDVTNWAASHFNCESIYNRSHANKHAVQAATRATPSRAHADYHNALISLGKWGPFHLFCHSCSVAISLIYPIYLAFQTLSCLAQQSARGWGPPQPMAVPGLRTAAFHCGLGNGPLTPECAHTGSLQARTWWGGSRDGFSKTLERRSFGTHTHTQAQCCRDVCVRICESLHVHKCAHTRGCVRAR